MGNGVFAMRDRLYAVDAAIEIPWEQVALDPARNTPPDPREVIGSEEQERYDARPHFNRSADADRIPAPKSGQDIVPAAVALCQQ